MAFTARLCNPSPFSVKLPWDRGVNIYIEAFGSTELSMAQLDDFRPGKPGSADVAQVLNYFGLFLLDADRPYDNQALEALRKAHAAKKSQHDAAVRNIIDRRAAAGVTPNDDALNETLEQMGYNELNRKIGILKDAVKEFEKAVGSSPEQSLRRQLDPKRTVFVLDPPREFPSVAAMEFFLRENPAIKANHVAYNQQAAGEISAPVEKVTPTQEIVSELAQKESPDVAPLEDLGNMGSS